MVPIAAMRRRTERAALSKAHSERRRAVEFIVDDFEIGTRAVRALEPADSRSISLR